MGTITKHKKKIQAPKIYGEVDSNVGNYEKHPFFVKKANEAKALLEEVGLPKELAKRKLLASTGKASSAKRIVRKK